jgi:hypothetical protein
MFFLQFLIFSFEQMVTTLNMLLKSGLLLAAIEANAILYFLVIGSDDASLFVVRRCLHSAGDRPIWSLILALIFASSTILLFNLILWPTIFMLLQIPRTPSASLFQRLSEVVARFRPIEPILISAPALAVHLWLPVLAAGAIGVRLLYSVFRAVAVAQWFIKQGNQHPLRAIGMVAGVLVFAGTAIVRLLVPMT